MPKLTDLNPTYSESPVEGAERLTFACPICRKRLIIIDVWPRVASDQWRKDGGGRLRVHHADSRDLAAISITPSIDDLHGKDGPGGCKGWHGFITNGVAA